MIFFNKALSHGITSRVESNRLFQFYDFSRVRCWKLEHPFPILFVSSNSSKVLKIIFLILRAICSKAKFIYLKNFYELGIF